MLLYVRHLAEGKRVSIGQKHRIVAEAVLAAWGPDQDAVHGSVEVLHVAIGPGDAERAHELRLALAGRMRAALAQPLFHRLHGSLKVLVPTRPARRVDPRLPPERVDGESGIVGECRRAVGRCRGARLSAGGLVER